MLSQAAKRIEEEYWSLMLTTATLPLSVLNGEQQDGKDASLWNPFIPQRCQDQAPEQPLLWKLPRASLLPRPLYSSMSPPGPLIPE